VNSLKKQDVKELVSVFEKANLPSMPGGLKFIDRYGAIQFCQQRCLSVQKNDKTTVSF